MLPVFLFPYTKVVKKFGDMEFGGNVRDLFSRFVALLAFDFQFPRAEK